MGDTIAAIATARGRGAIGIVKISGPEAFAILHRLFRPSAASGSAQGPAGDKRRLRHGWIRDPHTGELLDEVLAVRMPGPSSYTGEDVAEINGHGGGQVLATLLEAVLAAGARLAEPGEFTRRALLNGRIDLSQAEAVADLIAARSRRALQIARCSLEGELGRQVADLRQDVLDVLAGIEAEIDFADQLETESDSRSAGARIRERIVPRVSRWIAHYEAVKGYLEGVTVAVIGRPNVGKSSIINRLVKKERVIVTDVPGTTRDLVEVGVILGGMPVTFTDTAGLHESQDPVEIIGIQRTRLYLDQCQLVLLMVDAAAGIGEQDLRIGEILGERRVVVVFNKMDLVARRKVPNLPEKWRSWPAVGISARFDEQFDELEKVLIQSLQSAEGEPGGDIVPNLRQRVLLERCLQRLNVSVERLEAGGATELASIELTEAVGCLDQILGGRGASDVMDQVFQRFCIGK
jgi:tRNA modification GTPase